MTAENEVESKEDGETSVHLWSTILRDVANARIGKLPQGKGIIVLGDNGTGKSTLVSRLSHKNVPPKTPALEYHYVDVRDEATDDQTKLSAWVLDGDLIFVPFLKFTLSKKNFKDRVVIIVVDMERPWNIMDDLNRWANALEDYIQSIDIEIEDMEKYRNDLICQFREYIEPDTLHLHAIATNGDETTPSKGLPKEPESLTTSTPAPKASPVGPALHPATAALLGLSSLRRQQDVIPSENLDDLDSAEDENANEDEKESLKASKEKRSSSDVLKELPITPGALTNNLGIPIIVVVTKTDVMDDLERNKVISEEQFDIIQMHIRRFCLSYGAALIYVSAKNGKNCGLLNNYLQHRIYGFPFTQNAYVIDKDSVFIPSGWDSLNKISLLEQNLTKYKPGDEFYKVVPRPSEDEKTTSEEPQVTAVDDQQFLSQLYKVLQPDSTANGSGENGNDSTTHDQSSILDNAGTPTSRPSSGSATRGRTSGGGGGVLAGSSSEKVLASFFNNLLSKGPSARQSPSTPSGPPVGQASDPNLSQNEAPNLTTKEMQSELERLARTSKEALDNSQSVEEKSPATEKSS
ncbi:hypothetical protein Aperf_G00000001455 [Anoplocephala perfoliata]